MSYGLSRSVPGGPAPSSPPECVQNHCGTHRYNEGFFPTRFQRGPSLAFAEDEVHHLQLPDATSILGGGVWALNSAALSRNVADSILVYPATGIDEHFKVTQLEIGVGQAQSYQGRHSEYSVQLPHFSRQLPASGRAHRASVAPKT